VRRGAAWPPAERPSGRLPVQQAVPRALAGGLTAERHGCRVPRVPPTATRFGVPAASWCQDVRYPLCLARPVRVIRQRPCVQRPPGRRPACVRCPHVWCPMPGVRVRGPELSVRHRMSGVRCPVPASGIRACRVRVCSIRTGKFVEREGAAGSHTPRDRPGRRITLPICRAAGARRFAHCGRLREVGRSVLPAARHDLSPWVVGRPRWEVLGRQRERAPPRPKAAGGPQQQSGREGKPGLVSENCGGPAET
jgi:hypothetical protein